MRTTVLLFILVLVFGLTAGQAFAGSVGTIQLSANPSAIVADGKSICTVSAQVRDKNGDVVLNDTEVRFSSSLGVIEETGKTSAGVARVKLISSDIKGFAVITATWVEGQAVAQTKVEFGDATVLLSGPQYISVKADKYLGYSLDYKVLDGIGHVTIRYRSLELEASEAQVDLTRNRIVAKGDSSNPIKIRTADGFVTGNMFFCNMGDRGVLLSADDSTVQEIDISKSKPVVTGKTVSYASKDFAFKDLSDSLGLIKAKAATVFLNEKIQFSGAILYVNGKRRFSMPLYVLSLNGYQVDGKPYIDYSTNGIVVNLPFYYSLSPSSTGAFLITHASNPSWGSYGQTPGWGLDMRQQYKTDRSQGTLEFSRITSSDWGAHFQHSQQLDPLTQTYLYLDYPAHQNLFGNFNIDHTFNAFNLGMNLSGSRFDGGSNSMTGDLYARTKAKSIGKSIFKYTFSGTAAYTRTDIKSEVATPITVIDPVTGLPTIVNSLSTMSNSVDGATQKLQGNLYTAPLNITKSLSLTGSLSLGYLWANGSTASGTSVLNSYVMNWKISPRSNFQLGYRYADRPSVYTTTVGKQSMTASWRYDTERLHGSVYAIRGLDYSTLNFFGDLSYRVTPSWRVGFRSTLNDFGSISYKDMELSLGRKIGSRELIALWSESQHRIMLEMGTGSF
ncbi:MAG TPA: Ig-like domain-containing protein [Armatimonadota bacterium]|jgi:hypothetical protein